MCLVFFVGWCDYIHVISNNNNTKHNNITTHIATQLHNHPHTHIATQPHNHTTTYPHTHTPTHPHIHTSTQPHETATRIVNHIYQNCLRCDITVCDVVWCGVVVMWSRCMRCFGCGAVMWQGDRVACDVLVLL